MLDDNPEFDFRFMLASKFELTAAIDDSTVKMVKSAAIQVQWDNWQEYVVQSMKNGSPGRVTWLNPADFQSAVHGAEFQVKQDAL